MFLLTLEYELRIVNYFAQIIPFLRKKKQNRIKYNLIKYYLMLI